MDKVNTGEFTGTRNMFSDFTTRNLKGNVEESVIRNTKASEHTRRLLGVTGSL